MEILSPGLSHVLIVIHVVPVKEDYETAARVLGFESNLVSTCKWQMKCGMAEST